MAEQHHYISFRDFDKLNSTPPTSQTSKKWFRLGFPWLYKRTVSRGEAAGSSAKPFNLPSVNTIPPTPDVPLRDNSGGSFKNAGLKLDQFTALTRTDTDTSTAVGSNQPQPYITTESVPPSRRSSFTVTPSSSRAPSVRSFRGDSADILDSPFYQHRPQTPLAPQRIRRRAGTLFHDPPSLSRSDRFLHPSRANESRARIPTESDAFSFSSLSKSTSMGNIFRRKSYSRDRDFWMKDETTRYCFKCQQQFTAFRRRHHCRLCGQIFCGNCAFRMVNGAPFGESHSIRICEICYVNYMASDDMVLSGDHPTPTPRTDELLWQRQQYKSSHHRHSRSAISVTNLTTHYSHPQPSLDLKRLKSPDSAKSLGALHSNVTASAVSATKLHTHEKSPLTKYPSITPGGPTYAFHATARRIAYQDDHDNCAFLGTQFGPQHEGQGRAMLGSDIARSRLPCYGEPGTFDSSRAASLPPYPDELRGSTQPFSCRAELLAKKEACDGMNAEARQRLSVDIKHPALDGFSLEQLRRLTRQLLSEAGVPEKRGWDSILFRMATLAAHLVRPNIQANDNIDLRQYVRIKRIPGGSPSDSQYISGVVFTKAFVYRQMLQAQRDPSIMIITFPLTYEQPENRFISFDAAAPQEEEYMTKLVDRIIRYRPTVIFAEKTVSRSALRRLADNGISVAFNIKRNVLRAISRCTGASIITSVDKFALGPKLGYCGAVWSEFVEDPSLPKIAKPFIFIDGCQPEYGATLVLRGESFDRLEAIKNAADLLVSFAYSLRLETSLLLCEYALTVLPRPPAATDRGATQAAPLPATDTPAARALCKYQVLLSSSPSVHVPPPYVLVQMKIHEDAIRDINARYQKNPSFKKGNLASLTTNPATTLHKSGVDFLLSRQSKEAMEFRTSFAYEIELSVHMPYIQEGEAFLHANPGPVNPLDHQNLALSYIVTCGENDNEVCVPPQIYVIDFYGDTDITLGQYLEKLCFDLDYDCPGKDPCDYPMYQHCRSYVHCTGRLDVTMEEYPCPIPTMSEVLLMWGVCSKCGISTPITPMLDDASRYSFGKYLELLFYGTPSSPRASLCKHDIHHDYVRWFALHNMAVKFMFREIRPLDVKTPTMLIYQNFDIQARLKKKEAAELREKLRRYYESVITRLRTFPMDYVDVANKEDCKQDLDDMVARANTELEYINQLLDQTMQSSHYADVLALFVVYEQMQSKVLEWSLKFTRLIEKFIGFELDNRLNGPAGGNLSAATSAIGKLSRVVSLDNLSMSEKQQIPAGGQHKDFINNLNVDMGTDQMGSLSGQTTQFATQTPCMPLLGHSPSSSEVHLPLPEVDPAANPETRKANIFRRLSLRLLREERERSEKHSAVVAPAAAAPTSAAAAAAAATSAATPTTEEKHTRKSTRTGGEYEAGTGPGHLIHPNPPPVYPETGLHARPQAIGKSRVPTIYHKKQKATTATAPAMTPLSRDGSGGLTGHRMLSVSSIDSASSAGHEKPQRVPATKIPTYRATTQKGPARRSIAGPPDGGISGSRGLELFESRIPRLAGPPQRGAHGSHKDLDRNLDSSTLMRITRRLSGLDEDSSRKTLPLGDVSRKMSFWIPAAAQYISRHPKRPSLSQVNLFQTRVGSNNKQSSNQSLKPPGPHSLGSAQQQGRADKTTVGRASHQQRQYMSLPSSRNYKLSSHIQAPQSQRSKDQSDRRSTSSRAARASLASSSQRKPSFGSELRNTTRPHLGLGLNWARSIGRSKSQSQPTSSQPRQAPSHRRARDRGAEDDDDDDDDEYDYEYYYDNDKEGAENYPASRSKWKAATMAPSIDSSVGDLQDNNVASGMDSISIDTDDEEGEGLSSSSSSSSDNDSSSHLSSFDWSIFDIDKDAPLSMVAEEKGEGEVKKETEGKKVHDEDTAAHDRGNNHESGGHGPAYDHYREYSVSELSPRLEIANMQAESSPSRRYRRRNTLSGDGVSDGDDDEAHDEDDSPLSPDLHFDDGAGGSDIEDTAPTIEMTDETGKVVTEGRHPDSGSAAPARRRSEERASMGLRNEKAVSPMAVPKRRALDEGSIQRFSKPTSPREAAGARAGLTDQTQADNVRTVWKTLSEMFQSPASKQLLQISQDIDYPFLSTDHVIARSPIIVRETELSSIVGFTLTAPEYTAALNGLIQKSMVNFEGPGAVPLSDEQRRELELENTLCNMPIGHLRFKFNGGETSFSCRVFFPAQFDALRRCCGCNSNFVDSMSRCVPWEASGGKSGSAFLKTLDDRYLIKQISKQEMSAFLKFAPHYFRHMYRTYRGEMLTIFAKILGMYTISFKNRITGKSTKINVIVQENLFYGRKVSKIFDLKGSLRNRMVSEDKESAVWQDENLLKFIRENPIYIREHTKQHLHDAIWNDTLFLSKVDVMDYSLLVGLDEENKEIYVGIVDFIRTYTWDKKLESWVKEAGLLGGGGKVPTIISPKQYKNRFREAMDNYFLVVPDRFGFELADEDGSF